MEFSHMIFYVHDIPRALDFYEKVFGMKIKFLHESNQYAELDTGTTCIAFASNELGNMNLPEGYIHHDPCQKPFACEIAFTVDDVCKVYDRAVGMGAIPVAEPKEKPWGQIIGYVRDPNGVLIEITSRMR